MAEQAIYSVDDLVTRVRNLYDETDSSNSASTNAQLIYFLNAAMQDLVAEVPINPQKKTLAGTDFTDSAYTFTERVLRIDSVEVNTYPIDPIRFSDRQFYTSPLSLLGRNVSQPPGWAWRGNQLFIPSVNDGDSIVVYYQGALEEVASGDTPSLPFYANNYLIYRVLCQWNMKDQNGQMADYYEKKADKELRQLARRWKSVQVPMNQITKVYY